MNELPVDLAYISGNGSMKHLVTVHGESIKVKHGYAIEMVVSPLLKFIGLKRMASARLMKKWFVNLSGKHKS